MSDVQTRWTALSLEVADLCRRAGRTPASVEVLAVSKLQPTEALRAAYAAGVRAFGENYAQELRDKAQALANLPDIRWHAIGGLQTNKAKYVARSAHAFHALDRIALADELAQRRVGAPLEVYLEVNLGGEATKSGLLPAEVGRLLDHVQTLPQLVVAGLMCLPPFAEDPELSRPYFAQLRELAALHQLAGLSMGTSQDYAVAVQEGATVVRVGTALFGPRPTR
jgi:PLP dependent protein